VKKNLYPLKRLDKVKQLLHTATTDEDRHDLLHARDADDVVHVDRARPLDSPPLGGDANHAPLAHTPTVRRHRCALGAYLKEVP
jgi:hypothetical protein